MSGHVYVCVEYERSWYMCEGYMSGHVFVCICIECVLGVEYERSCICVLVVEYERSCICVRGRV